jgi:hypothetical protein
MVDEMETILGFPAGFLKNGLDVSTRPMLSTISDFINFIREMMGDIS